MSMLIAMNLQNRIVCASDTRITITNPDGSRGNPVDTFRKTSNLNKNIIFMGAGSVQMNCLLAPELTKLCGENDHIQDLLEKLKCQGLAEIVMKIQNAHNIFDPSISVTCILAGMNTAEPQIFSVNSLINRITEIRNYGFQDEIFLDQEIKSQLDSLGASFKDSGPDLSKVPRDATITMSKKPKSEIIKYSVTLARNTPPSITTSYYQPFEICVVAPSIAAGIEFVANEATHAVEFARAKPKLLKDYINEDAMNLLSRFKILSEAGKIDDVVNGGLIFTEILPDQIVWNDGKLWRQMVNKEPEKISDTKMIGRKLHIYSEAEKKYMLMRAYTDPFNEHDYIGSAVA